MKASVRSILRRTGSAPPPVPQREDDDRGGRRGGKGGGGRRRGGGRGAGGDGGGSRPPEDGIVRVGRETKGRKGKGVTVVTGVPLQGEALQVLARELKALCGAGGTVRGAIIEIQGDHRDRLVPALESKGWTVRRSGG